jgi:hypothetical protein
MSTLLSTFSRLRFGNDLFLLPLLESETCQILLYFATKDSEKKRAGDDDVASDVGASARKWVEDYIIKKLINGRHNFFNYSGNGLNKIIPIG